MTAPDDRSSDTNRFDRIEGHLDRIDERLDASFELMTERFGRIDERFERIDERFERIDERFERIDQRFENTDRTIDRILTVVMDHGRDITEIKADVRQMRVSMDGLRDSVVEHLGWHLGQS